MDHRAPSALLSPESIRPESAHDPYAFAATLTRPAGGVGPSLSYDRPQKPSLASSTASSSASPRHSPAHSTMPVKRTTSDDAEGNPSKLIKTEHPEEFSNAVKKRLQSSSRTGQACDRCKIRKIRCDGLPGGCSPCLQNNTECRTTDRITGRATSRGYVEGLEQQNRDMQHRIRELEQRLVHVAAGNKSGDGFADAGHTNYGYEQPSSVHAVDWNVDSHDYNNQTSDAMVPRQQDPSLLRAPPVFRAGVSGDNFLGVSPGNSKLSAIKGTALSILGMEIDIADFDSLDMDEPDSTVFHPQLYNKSYQAFLQTALNINPKLEKVELPPRSEGLTYADWYIRVLNPYMPLLHKRTFLELLTRMYDDPTFQPTPAQTVIVHMVFAIMFFQYAVRNFEDKAGQDDLNRRSNLHYHYSLGFFYQLSCSHTWQDVQALTMICAHLRNFPKPGASWMLSQTTISTAMELGLHRSSKKWNIENPPNPLDEEMQKRTFWALLAIHVALSGKMGRPIALRFEDFDVELPEPMDDDLLSETGLDTSRPGTCSHKISLEAWKVVPLYMEMYSTIYAVRRKPESYIPTVNSLESQIRAWKDNLPPEFSKKDMNDDDNEGKIFALYTQAWALEFRLLLRHPSVSATNDAKFNAESMRICVESSRQMLGVVRQLQKYKCLDTTWYNSAVYVMAITTTLFSQWDKRGEVSAADLAALREEMDIWLDIMGDVGMLLGSGTRLREAVRVVTDGTLSLLSRSLPNKANYQAIEEPKPARQKSASNPAECSPPQNFKVEASAQSYVPEAHLQQSTSYPAATQYPTYTETPASQSLAYTPANNYHAYTPNTTNSMENQLITAYPQTSQVAQNAYHMPMNSSTNAWHQWTNTLAGGLEAEDCYSASALMSLGSGDVGHQTTRGPITQMTVTAALENGTGMGGMSWPLNLFDNIHGV